jgi:hypothetical protein
MTAFLPAFFAKNAGLKAGVAAGKAALRWDACLR